MSNLKIKRAQAVPTLLFLTIFMPSFRQSFPGAEDRFLLDSASLLLWGERAGISRRRRRLGARWRRCASAPTHTLPPIPATTPPRARDPLQTRGSSAVLLYAPLGPNSASRQVHLGRPGSDGRLQSGQMPAFLQGVSSPKPSIHVLLHIIHFPYSFLPPPRGPFLLQDL